MFGLFKTVKTAKNIAEKIYGVISIQSRNKIFYSFNEVPDDIDGRFDVLMLHANLVGIRLKKESESISTNLSQDVFDEIFRNMELSLREVGVGDVRLGKQINNMMQAYYGRMESYDIGINQYLEKKDISILEDSLLKNLYSGQDNVDRQKLRMMAHYVVDSFEALAKIDDDDISSGNIYFVQPPGAGYKDIV